MIKFKRGDAVVIHWDFRADISGYTAGRFLLRALGSTDVLIVDLGHTFTGQSVDIPLTSSQTDLPPGEYRGEVELSPGPHTWPSNGYETVIVLDDLA